MPFLCFLGCKANEFAFNGEKEKKGGGVEKDKFAFFNSPELKNHQVFKGIASLT